MNTDSADNPENRGTHGVSPLILTSQDVLSGKHLFGCMSHKFNGGNYHDFRQNQRNRY